MIVRRFLDWFFRSRETGAITIAQWPNLVLWIVIVAGLLLWIWPSAGRASVALTIVVKGGLMIWGADEIVRGVNPWRRCLGAAVVVYELFTLVP
ncbi:putative membrane protein YhhN [Bradyrhizobium yuanmingense]